MKLKKSVLIYIILVTITFIIGGFAYEEVAVKNQPIPLELQNQQ